MKNKNYIRECKCCEGEGKIILCVKCGKKLKKSKGLKCSCGFEYGNGIAYLTANSFNHSNLK